MAMTTISVFYSDVLTLSSKVNFLLYNLATISIVNGASYIVIKSYDRVIAVLIKKYKKILILIFFVLVSISSLQIVTRSQILPAIGNIIEHMPYYIFGLNYERLFLNEYLIIGAFIIGYSNNITRSIKSITTYIPILVIYLTGSYTGLIGSVSLLIRYWGKNKLFIAVLMLGIVGLSVGSKIQKMFLPAYLLKEREFRYDSYFNDYKDSNWRYIASASLFNESAHKFKLFGNGFMANKKYLENKYADYVFNKHRISLSEEKQVSSHTFISIFYDQGLFGIIIWMVFFILSIKYIPWPNNYHFGTDPLKVIMFPIIVTSLLRYLLYYHELQHWHMLVAVILQNYYVMDKNKST